MLKASPAEEWSGIFCHYTFELEQDARLLAEDHDAVNA